MIDLHIEILKVNILYFDVSFQDVVMVVLGSSVVALIVLTNYYFTCKRV